MNKKQILLFSFTVIILFLAISNVSATENNNTFNTQTIEDSSIDVEDNSINSIEKTSTKNMEKNTKQISNSNNITLQSQQVTQTSLSNKNSTINTLQKTSNQSTVSSTNKNSSTPNQNTTLKTATNKHTTKININSVSSSIYNKVTLKATIIDKNTNRYLTSGTIAFKVNGITVGKSSIVNGKANLIYDTSKLSVKNYKITVIFGETPTHYACLANNVMKLTKANPKIVVNHIKTYVTNKITVITTVADNNKYISGGNVVFKINGVTVGQSKLSNGKAIFNYDTDKLIAKKYTINTIFSGNNYYNIASASNSLVLTKLNTKTQVSQINTQTGTTTTLKAVIKDIKGNLLNYGTATFKINGIIVGKTSVKNGVASLFYTTPHIVKTSTINVVYAANNRYTASSSNNSLTTSLKIGILRWGSTGTISKNTNLYNNLVKSSITTNILKAATQGTPYVILGDGNGPTIFVTAGIHGSELSSQAAAIKLINTLATQTIHGTLYILPFVAPNISAANTRTYNSQNLNSVANVAGTISNNVYKLALSKNAVALGDFHCTQPGGKPGANAIFGSYSPRSSSASLASYISSKTGFKKIIYNKAGTEYPGALEDYCNTHSITSVTCEVLTPHGTVASGSVTKSYTMMTTFLKYYKLL